MKKEFIKTLDKKVADKLILAGFTQLSFEEGTYTFLNNGTLVFDDNENKCIFTDILSV